MVTSASLYVACLACAAVAPACASETRGDDTATSLERAEAASAAAMASCGDLDGERPNDGSVWPSNASKLVARDEGGGFVGPYSPPGSDCVLSEATYTLMVGTRILASAQCEAAGAGAPLHLRFTTRTISSEELCRVSHAMRGLILSDRAVCGADKPFLSVAVSTFARTTTTYRDEVNSCQTGNDPYVRNIDAVFEVLQALAMTPSQ